VTTSWPVAEPLQFGVQRGDGCRAGAENVSRLVLDRGGRRYDVTVTAADIAPLMLARARTNVARAGLTERVSVENADILALPYPEASFDRCAAALSPARLRTMAWLMPRMMRAVLYLAYVVIVGTKPDGRHGAGWAVGRWTASKNRTSSGSG
jgi:hypothetical protein